MHLSETRYVYPDVTVSCDERDRGSIDTISSPRLIIEVLSPGTEAYDRGRKFAYDRECPTIQEDVLSDSQRIAVEIYRRQTSTLWTLHVFGPGDEIELISLNIRFPL